MMRQSRVFCALGQQRSVVDVELAVAGIVWGVADGASPCEIVVATLGGIENAVAVVHHRGHDGCVFKHLSDGETPCPPKAGSIEFVAGIAMFIPPADNPVVEYRFCDLLGCEV